MEAGQKDLARLLLAKGASPEPLLNRSVTKKDSWDKLTATSAVLSFFSSVLIALVAGYFTHSYNKRQIELNETQEKHETATKDQATKVVELEAVQRLIPILTAADEMQKAAALTAINDLAHPDLAAHFAVLFKGRGSVEYLQQAAVSDTQGDKRTAVQALSTIVSSGTESDSQLAANALSTVFNTTGNSVFRVTISINIAETVDRTEANKAEQALRSHGYDFRGITVKRASESPHETTVRFFQYDRKTVSAGKELVSLLKSIGFNVRTEFDAEFVGDSSRPTPPPGTFEFWIGTTPSYTQNF